MSVNHVVLTVTLLSLVNGFISNDYFLGAGSKAHKKYNKSRPDFGEKRFIGKISWSYKSSVFKNKNERIISSHKITTDVRPPITIEQDGRLETANVVNQSRFDASPLVGMSVQNQEPTDNVLDSPLSTKPCRKRFEKDLMRLKDNELGLGKEFVWEKMNRHKKFKSARKILPRETIKDPHQDYSIQPFGDFFQSEINLNSDKYPIKNPKEGLTEEVAVNQSMSANNAPARPLSETEHDVSTKPSLPIDLTLSNTTMAAIVGTSKSIPKIDSLPIVDKPIYRLDKIQFQNASNNSRLLLGSDKDDNRDLAPSDDTNTSADVAPAPGVGPNSEGDKSASTSLVNDTGRTDLTFGFTNQDDVDKVTTDRITHDLTTERIDSQTNNRSSDNNVAADSIFSNNDDIIHEYSKSNNESIRQTPGSEDLGNILPVIGDHENKTDALLFTEFVGRNITSSAMPDTNDTSGPTHRSSSTQTESHIKNPDTVSEAVLTDGQDNTFHKDMSDDKTLTEQYSHIIRNESLGPSQTAEIQLKNAASQTRAETFESQQAASAQLREFMRNYSTITVSGGNMDYGDVLGGSLPYFVMETDEEDDNSDPLIGYVPLSDLLAFMNNNNGNGKKLKVERY